MRWGPADAVPVLWDTETTATAQHVVSLRGLASATAYRVTITATSAAGENIATAFTFTSAPAPASPEAHVRDGVLLVDGAPFFPLIAWQQCPEVLGTSLDAGINLFAAGSPCASAPSTLDAVSGRALVTAADGSSSPGLLGAFYPDEADLRGLTGATLPALPAGVRFLTITSHFASQAAPLPAGRGVYPGLVAAADVVGFDLYPLQGLCRRDFLPVDFDAQQELEALAPGKPTFQWIEVRGMLCGTTPGVEVSAATIRTEAWLAIAAGAHGLAFFPPDWDADAVPAIAGIAARIRQLEPALLEPVQPVTLTAPAGVRAAARSYNGALYVIAVNAGTTTASVHIAVPGLGDRPLLALDTQRQLLPHGGAFDARLAPLHVGIYVAAP